MAYLIDGILVAVLLVMIVIGAKRGLIESLFNFLSVILALIGAIWAAKHLAPYLASYLTDGVEQRIAEKLQQAVQSVGDPPEAIRQYVPEILRGYGFYEIAVQKMSRLIESAISYASEVLIPAAARETALQVANAIADVVVFLLAFIVLSLLMRLLAALVEKIFKLPVLKQVNGLGGAVFGGLKGILILLIFAWAVRYLGILIPQDLMEQTTLLQYLVNLIS